MEPENILEIGIDASGRLYVAPCFRQFPYIYREAMEVNWDSRVNALHSPPPPRVHLWPVPRWFEQINAAAKAQDCELCITKETRWVGVPDEIRQEILTKAGLWEGNG
jgi:hypothetical protein